MPLPSFKKLLDVEVLKEFDLDRKRRVAGNVYEEP